MTKFMHSLAALALFAPLCQAQGGGFAAGEMAFYSPYFHGFQPGQGALLRIDPVQGGVTPFFDLPGSALTSQLIAYDSFRDRVLATGLLTSSGPWAILAVDAQGSALPLATYQGTFRALTPAAAGRIYYTKSHTSSDASKIRYLDAMNVEHDLLDETGTQAYLLEPGFSVAVGAMIWNEANHALIAVYGGSASYLCSGTWPFVAIVKKLTLSADGSQLSQPEECAQFDLGPSIASIPNPVGVGQLPNGHVLVVVDPNTSQTVPTMFEIDPDTLAISVYGSLTGPFGSALSDAGTYSTALGKAVVLTTLNPGTGAAELNTFAAGEVGSGTPLATSQAVTPPANGVRMSLTQIAPGECGTNNVDLYCTPKTTSSGCVPTINTQGGPSASVGSGFLIRCSQVERNKPGIFFYGKSGANNVPFQGGTLCVKPPTFRTAPQNSGGGATCEGVYTFDFNAWIAGGNDPTLVPGTTVHGQFWFRDPSDATSGTGLSAGVSFTICQ